VCVCVCVYACLCVSVQSNVPQRAAKTGRNCYVKTLCESFMDSRFVPQEAAKRQRTATWLGGCDWPHVTAFVIGSALGENSIGVYSLAGHHGTPQAGLWTAALRRTSLEIGFNGRSFSGVATVSAISTCCCTEPSVREHASSRCAVPPGGSTSAGNIYINTIKIHTIQINKYSNSAIRVKFKKNHN